jgi:FkbM family methyltransferase
MVRGPLLLKRIWGLRKWRRFTSVLLRRLRISHLFRMRVGSISLVFHPAALTIRLWENPGRYDFDVGFFRAYLRPGDTCIDAGANVGLLTLTASELVGDEGCVIAVEAHPRTYRYLRENLKLNRCTNVRACHAALAAAPGTLLFSEEAEDDIRHVVPSGPGLRVPAVTLDSLTAAIDTVHLLKLDVEGYECEVLRGADRTLSITECVYFESFEHQTRRYGHPSRDLFQLLIDKGFSLFFPPAQGDRALRPVPPEHGSQTVENLVAVRDVPAFLERTWAISGRNTTGSTS